MDQLVPSWSPADVDAAALWAASGAQWLTADGALVPAGLVRTVVGAVRFLDGAGAGLAALSVADGVGLLAERAAAVGLGPSARRSCGGATQLLDAMDATVAITLARDADIEMLPAWLGISGNDGERRWDDAARAVAERSAAAVIDRGVLLGVPCALVGEIGPSAESPVYVDRLASAPPIGVDELLVVNLAALWAGPLCADVLARLGARVITVESEQRPDGSRRTLGFFESMHGRTESVCLPLHTERGRRHLASLIASADVVIEGSRPRALEQLGIDAAGVVRTGVRAWVSITGHGRTGPAAARVAFGDDAAAAGGLVGSHPSGSVFLADAVADPLTGLTAAAAVVQLAASGGRHLVDVPLARVSASARRGQPDVAPTCVADRPRRRTDPGAPLPLGRDTERVMSEFGAE